MLVAGRVLGEGLRLKKQSPGSCLDQAWVKPPLQPGGPQRNPHYFGSWSSELCCASEKRGSLPEHQCFHTPSPTRSDSSTANVIKIHSLYETSLFLCLLGVCDSTYFDLRCFFVSEFVCLFKSASSYNLKCLCCLYLNKAAISAYWAFGCEVLLIFIPPRGFFLSRYIMLKVLRGHCGYGDRNWFNKYLNIVVRNYCHERFLEATDINVKAINCLYKMVNGINGESWMQIWQFYLQWEIKRCGCHTAQRKR